MTGFWSGRCGSEEVAAVDSASQAFASQFSNYRLVVGEELVVVVTGDSGVVPKGQPDGALSATTEISGEEVPLDEPLIFEDDIEFVSEDGTLRVANCGELFLGDEDEPGEEEGIGPPGGLEIIEGESSDSAVPIDP